MSANYETKAHVRQNRTSNIRCSLFRLEIKTWRVSRTADHSRVREVSWKFSISGRIHLIVGNKHHVVGVVPKTLLHKDIEGKSTRGGKNGKDTEIEI